MRKRITLRLSDNIHSEIKKEAKKLDISTRDLIILILQNYVCQGTHELLQEFP